jgi:hypothetical protein
MLEPLPYLDVLMLDGYLMPDEGDRGAESEPNA